MWNMYKLNAHTLIPSHPVTLVVEYIWCRSEWNDRTFNLVQNLATKLRDSTFRNGTWCHVYCQCCCCYRIHLTRFNRQMPCFWGRVTLSLKMNAIREWIWIDFCIFLDFVLHSLFMHHSRKMSMFNTRVFEFYIKLEISLRNLCCTVFALFKMKMFLNFFFKN